MKTNTDIFPIQGHYTIIWNNQKIGKTNDPLISAHSSFKEDDGKFVLDTVNCFVGFLEHDITTKQYDYESICELVLEPIDKKSEKRTFHRAKLVAGDADVVFELLPDNDNKFFELSTAYQRDFTFSDEQLLNPDFDPQPLLDEMKRYMEECVIRFERADLAV